MSMENLVKEFENFWLNKRILITGHTGFKGSWLSFILKMFGSKLYGISLKPKNNSHYIYAKSSKNFEKEFFFDIGKKDFKKKLRIINPDIIFHLAAQPLVSSSIKNPIYTYQTNLIGLVRLLENIKILNNLSFFLNITSDKVYTQSIKNQYFTENKHLGGGDPYSNSKACSELITQSHFETFFDFKKIFFATARSGNVIGGGDYSKNRIVPDFFKSVKLKKTLNIRNPNHIRPWQHVLDPLFGYLLLSWKITKIQNYYSSWNFGPNYKSQIPVKTLIEKLSTLNNYKKIKFLNSGSFNETVNLRLNSNKARKLLGWRPILNLDQTLFYTSNWYKQYLLDNTITEKQITNFYLKFIQKVLRN